MIRKLILASAVSLALQYAAPFAQTNVDSSRYSQPTAQHDGTRPMTHSTSSGSLASLSPKQQSLGKLILGLVGAETTKQFQAHLAKISRTAELQNQAFSIKGGAAVVGDDYYIMMSGDKNRLLDARQDKEWIGKAASEYQVICYDQQRRLTVPRSIDDIRSMWVIIFAKERVYFVNLDQGVYGFYEGGGRSLSPFTQP